MKADMVGVPLVRAAPNIRFNRLGKPIIEKVPYGLALGSHGQTPLMGAQGGCEPYLHFAPCRAIKALSPAFAILVAQIDDRDPAAIFAFVD